MHGLLRALESRANRLPRTGKVRVISRGGKACSICRDGLCNASIRNVPLAATGCGQPTPEESSAAIAALRSATFHRPSAHACGCVPARWEIIVHRAARQGGTGSLHEQVSGPLVPVTPGRAVPAISLLKVPYRNYRLNFAPACQLEIRTRPTLPDCRTAHVRPAAAQPRSHRTFICRERRTGVSCACWQAISNRPEYFHTP
jgi:hypothetical protein